MNAADGLPAKTPLRPLRHFFWLFALAVVLPGLLLGLTLAWWTAQQLAEHQREEARSLAATSADYMGHHLKTLSTAIAVLSQLPLGKDDYSVFYRVASGFSANEGFSVTLADGEGNQFLNTRLPLGTTLPRRESMDSVRQAIASGRPHVSEIFMGKMSGHHVVTVDAPVATPFGLRIITLFIDASSIANVLSQTEIPAGRLTGIIDEHGVFVARSKDQDLWVGKPTRPETVDAARTSANGMIYTQSMEGLPVLNVFHRLEGADWTVLVAIPQTVLYGPVLRPVAILVALMLLATASTALLAYGFHRKFNRAASRLLTIARDPFHIDHGATTRNTFAEFEVMAGILKSAAERQQHLVAALSENQERYHAVLSALSEGVISQAPDGEILSCNPAAERILGLTVNQMRGLQERDPSWRAVHADGSPFPFKVHPGLEVLRTGVPQSNVIMGISTSGGQQTWLSVSAMPIFHPGQAQPAFVVVSFSDITERRRAEGALELERRKLAAAFENPAVGFILSDAQGGGLSMNATALALFDHAGNENLNGRLEDTVNVWALQCGDGRLLPLDQWPLVRAIRGEFVRNLELYGRNTLSGKTWVCNLTTTPVHDRSGKVILILQTLFDITVTNRLVELMGGAIGVDSTVGVGSVFWIEMPLTAAPPRPVVHALPAAPARPPVPDGATLRTVLYVEDNAANLELVQELLLRRPDLRLLCAADGHAGVECARNHVPDVILMDLHLPGIGGVEAMRILQADPVLAHIPVIALSATALPRDVEQAMGAGFFNYLTKPIRVHEFLAALDAALEFSAQLATLAARPA